MSNLTLAYYITIYSFWDYSKFNDKRINPSLGGTTRTT
jgi:hypothetical protein